MAFKRELKEIVVTEQADWGMGDMFPMTDVPDLNSVADSCDEMSQRLSHHSKHLRGMASMQPSFNEQFGGETDSGLPEVGY